MRLLLNDSDGSRVRDTELKVSFGRDVLRLHVLQLGGSHIFGSSRREELVAHTANRNGNVGTLATKGRHILGEADGDGGGRASHLLLAANLLSATPFLQTQAAYAS